MTAAGSLTCSNIIYLHWFFPIINPSFGSLLYALAFVLVCFVPVLFLYRKKDLYQDLVHGSSRTSSEKEEDAARRPR